MSDLTIPLSNPVQIFLTALIILLFAPLLMKRLHIPGIIGLIAAGALIGPHGLNLLQKSGGIELLSTAGMLYIMFLAGLEIDFNDFKKNYRNGLLFGVLTFFCPILIGIGLTYYVLGLSFYAALITGSMVGTHTLVSYPIVRKLGLSRTQTVATATAGTFIADTAVLLVVAVVVAAQKGELSGFFWGQLIVSIALFGIAIVWGFPLISRYFMRYIASDDITQYLFILTMIFLAGFLAQLADLEPIIGSFLAGFALNRIIPHTSVLMDKITFAGNLFIPFFLLSVGMVVNINGLFDGPQTLLVALIIILSSQLGKFLAAFFSGKILRYNILQRNLLFGLSNAHAAATMAVILVGHRRQLLSDEIINGAVLLIPISCLISTLVAEHYGRKIAAEVNQNKLPEWNNTPEKILVPVANPHTIQPLFELALMLKPTQTNEEVYAISITIESENAEKDVALNRQLLGETLQKMGVAGQNIKAQVKIDNNISVGILRAIYELPATEIIMGWNDKHKATDKIFGTIINILSHKTGRMILVPHLIAPPADIKQIMVMFPVNAEVEQGFVRWLRVAHTLAWQTKANLRFLGPKNTLDKVKYIINSLKQQANVYYTTQDHYEQYLSQSAADFAASDMLMIVTARPHTASFTHHLLQLPAILTHNCMHTNFMLVYPEQGDLLQNNKTIFSDVAT